MVSDSDSSNRCGSGGKSPFEKKGNECTEKPDPWKRPCKPVRKGSDEKCHSSHEQFKKRDECRRAAEDDKCHSSRRAFREPPGEEESGSQCHDSQTQQAKCPSPVRERTSCQSSIKAKAAETTCSSSKSSTYSKLSTFCKDLAKEYVKLKPKAKCGSIEESIKSESVRSHMPISKPPCSPFTEKGLEQQQAKAQCTNSKVNCTEIKKPSFADFFPLDVRNKKLNDCVEKYMRIDPGQVISKCSQFASKTSQVSGKCLQTVKQSQERCMQTVRSSGPVRRTSMMIPNRTRQMMGRWAPTAAAYLATSAIVTVYVTEWKTVLKYVPFYSHLAEEQAPS